MNLRLTSSTADDWIFVFRCRNRWTRRVFERVIGVNGWASYETAMECATKHVQPPRAKSEGRTPEILDVKSYRLHDWLARGHAAPAGTGPILDTMKT